MQIKVFTIPIIGGEQAEAEMNRFLRGCRLLKVESKLVSEHERNYWCFCVQYLPNQPKTATKQEKVDYKQVLDERTFNRFAEFRKIRKQIAQEQAIPAYAIFTDKELAEVAKLNELTLKTLQTVDGIGQKKVERYGQAFIDVYLKTLKDEAEG